jgi:hypothetical protein
MAVGAKVCELLLYELPHFRPAQIQVDVYTTFREGDGYSSNECILSLESSRETARSIDWDEWPPNEIVDALGGRYSMGERGQPLPIIVEPPPSRDDSESETAGAGAAS